MNIATANNAAAIMNVLFISILMIRLVLNAFILHYNRMLYKPVTSRNKCMQRLLGLVHFKAKISSQGDRLYIQVPKEYCQTASKLKGKICDVTIVEQENNKK